MSFRISTTHSVYNKLFDKILQWIFYTGTFVIPLFYLPYTRDILTMPKEFALYTFVFAGLLVWLLKIVFSKELFIRRTILDIPLLFFLLAIIVSSIVSVSPHISFWGKANTFVLHTSIILAWVIWFWLFVQTIDNRDRLKYILTSLLLSGIVSACTFLFGGAGIFASALAKTSGNLVTDMNSLFGVYIALIGVIGFGLLMSKARDLIWQIIPAIAALISFVALIRLGFTVSWGIFAVGLALLLVVGITMLSETHTPVLSIVFFLFLASVVFIFIELPASFKLALPVEISLGLSASWDIISQSFFSSTRNFLFGSGPGTFVNDFSLFRPAVFNVNPLVWSVRFHNPYNSFFALLSEFGLLGSLSFLFTILVAIGSMFSGWLATRPSAFKRLKRKVVENVSSEFSANPVEIFVLVAAWLTATIGLAVAFYASVEWWLWWWLLAAIIVSLPALVPRVVTEKRILLQVSPQYALVMSFSVVFVVAAVIIFGAFVGRMYLAETIFTKASLESDLIQADKQFGEAIAFREAYTPYRISRARTLLQQAQVESQLTDPRPELIARLVADAVNEAKLASTIDNNSVETWETLTVMYVNARSFAPEANAWALETVNRAIELEPTNPVLHWHKGGIYIFDENLESAIEAYIEAIELKPDYVAAYNSLALVYESQEKLDEAIATYLPIIPLVQENSQLLFNIGRLYYNRNEAQDDQIAEQLWRHAEQLEPQYSNVLYSLGLLYERRAETDKAIDYFRLVEELNPENPDIGKKIENLLYNPQLLTTP